MAVLGGVHIVMIVLFWGCITILNLCLFCFVWPGYDSFVSVCLIFDIYLSIVSSFLYL